MRLLVAFFAWSASVSAALPSSRPSDCVDVSTWRAQYTFSGRLVERLFPSPSVSAPPEGERALILELDHTICAYDGGEFADPTLRFDRIHVWGPEEVRPALRTAIGRRVTLTGEAFPAHTGHHHAPLLLDVNQVTISALSP